MQPVLRAPARSTLAARLARFTLGIALAEDQQGKRTGMDDSELPANAADEPTAVWDAELLRQAGLDALGPLPDPSIPPPATPTSAAVQTAPSIMVDPRTSGAQPITTGKPRPPKELSWRATLGLALGLGTIVYALIRFLR
jgi:hypothetical protein